MYLRIQLLMISLVLGVAGASSCLSIHTIVGFDGLVRLGRWNPVIVEVENSGVSKRLAITVEIEKGMSYRTNRRLTYTRHSELPRGARKRYDFAVPLESSGNPIVIRVEHNGEIILEKKHSLLGKVVRTPLVVALSRSGAFDFLIPESVVTYPHPELMPELWNAYDAADAIIFHNADLHGLSLAQIDAIEQWIDTGGTLVVVGGSHLSVLPKQLQRLVPVDFVGLSSMSLEAPIPDVIKTQDPVDGSTAISRIAGVVGGGDAGVVGSSGAGGDKTVMFDTTKVLHAAGDTPLMLRHERGRGAVFVSGIDFGSAPMRNWSGRSELWSWFTATSTEPDSLHTPSGLFTDPLASAVMMMPDDTISSRTAFLIVVVAYLIGVFILFRRKKSGIGAKWWIVAGALVSVFTFAGYILFSRVLVRKPYVSSVTSTTEVRPGARYGTLRGDVAIVSTKADDYTVSITDRNIAVLSRTEEHLRTEITGSSVNVSGSVESPWDHTAFHVEAAVPLIVDSRVRRDDHTLEVELVNSSDRFLTRGMFLYRGTGYETGPFAPGARVTKSFRISNGIGTPSTLEIPGSSDNDTALSSVKQILAYERWNTLHNNGAILFIAWFTESPLQIETEERFLDRRGADALVFVIEPEEAGTRDA